MIVADELEADWKQVQDRAGPSCRCISKTPFWMPRSLWGAQAVRGFYEPLRKAGAAGRVMLIKAAAADLEGSGRRMRGL